MKKKRMMALLLTGFMAASTLAGFGGISVYATPEEEASQQTTAPDILMIARQGMFSSGGTVTAPVEGDYDATRTGWMRHARATRRMWITPMYFIRFLFRIMEIRSCICMDMDSPAWDG